METNIFMELFLLVLIISSIYNCQKRIRQGLSWAYHTSIILSLILIAVSIFMLVAFTKAAQINCDYLDISAIALWGIVCVGAIYNLITTKKIDITKTEVVVHPLIGKNKTHAFCKALCYTIMNKRDHHYSWKEITIFFNSRKIHVSSFQHKDYVDIYNQLIKNGIPEKKTEESHAVSSSY